jgi:hypothetical protein
MKSPLPNSQARATWLGFAPMASAMFRTISTAFMLASKFSPWKRGSYWRESRAVYSSARLTFVEIAHAENPKLSPPAGRGAPQKSQVTQVARIPAYGQKIDPRSNSLFGRENSLFGKNNSLFRQKNSLFHLLGNFAASI